MIQENAKKILSELPDGVKLVAVAKTRTAKQIFDAIAAGVGIIGENYVQEAERAVQGIADRGWGNVKWHFIGHLQTNKVKRAVRIFDMIETVDSFNLAKEIDKQCSKINKVMQILIEINSGKEEQKAGVYPEKAAELIQKISELNNIRIKGIMTMGPFSDDPEVVRPYFIETKKVFDKIKTLNIPEVEMEILSMGMSGSYRVAIEEGATMIRVGTAIFGERNYGN
ncbi:MAG: YggS family pyridoxal phosphate-dependent enzyme [Candidatus Saganbacteria bacterium]|nr:YggS family pyridoxal phosphate-dependent enzyme [Candidatus Saganbacteria bacterium]